MANQKSTKSSKTTSTKKNTTKATEKTTSKTTAKKAAPKSTTKSTPKKVEVKKEVTKTVEPKNEVTTKNETKNNNILAWAQDNLKLIGGFVIIALLIANIILIVNGHEVKLSEGKEVIASINGKEITAEELFDKLKELNGTNALVNMIDNYITDKEISEEDQASAKKSAQEQVDAVRAQYEAAGQNFEEVLTSYGYENESVLLEEFIDSYKKESIVKKYIEESLTDEEIKKYYNESVFDSYTVKHILITPDTTDDMTDEQIATAEATAKATAQEVINKLNAGETWATLVETYSEDEGSKDEEGLIENFTKGDVVDEFFNATVALKDKKYSSEPVKSEYGYHVIYRISSTAKKTLEDSKDEIVEELVLSKLSEDSTLYSQTWAEIRKEYKFTINDTTIKSAYEKAING